MFVAVAAITGALGLFLIPGNSDVENTSPDYKIIVATDKPDRTGTIYLNMAHATAGESRSGEIAASFDLAPGEQLRVFIAAVRSTKPLTSPDGRPSFMNQEAVPIIGKPGSQLGSGTVLTMKGAQTPPAPTSFSDIDAEDRLHQTEQIESVPITLPKPSVVTSGSQVAFLPPRVDLGNWISDSVQEMTYDGSMPPGVWFLPKDGAAVIVGPTDLSRLRADVSTPREEAPFVWTASRSLSVRWFGTELDSDRSVQRNVFLAGIFFGVAGAALIAALQELPRRREPSGAGAA